MKKGEHGLPHREERKYEATCNPRGQAIILNEKETELNVLLGLCVGHDMLLNRYSKAPVTTLVVKSRLLDHNPVAAIYSTPYLKEKFKPKVEFTVEPYLKD